MVEADSHLKLLPASILDIYTVFEHIGMLYIDHYDILCARIVEIYSTIKSIMTVLQNTKHTTVASVVAWR